MASNENWAAFRASIDALNTYSKPLVLRKYQSDILRAGSFVVTSPASGRPLDVTHSVRLKDRIAYFVPDDPPVWLLAGFVPQGFPLYEAVMQDGSVRPVTDDEKALKEALEKSDIERLLTIGPQRINTDADARVALIIGHQHFAHHIWNELAAFDAWLSSATDEELQKLDIVATYEPLGPLRQIFPKLSNAHVITDEEEIQQAIAAARISVRTGSRLVTRSVSSKVRAFSQEFSSLFPHHPAREGLENAWPRIWVSARVGSRIADNMEDFLLSVFRTVFSAYPNALFLLNGYAFPFRFFDDARTVEGRKNKANAFAGSVQEFIDHLRNRTREELGDRIASRVLSISGLEFPDAIAFGSYCDYYICHAGALQHMIAWFNNIPGFVHSPRPKGRDSTYNLDAVEDGQLPDLVPRGFVSSTDSTTKRPGKRNFNYEFVDLEKSARFVLRSMRSHLGEPRSREGG